MNRRGRRRAHRRCVGGLEVGVISRRALAPAPVYTGVHGVAGRLIQPCALVGCEARVQLRKGDGDLVRIRVRVMVGVGVRARVRVGVRVRVGGGVRVRVGMGFRVRVRVHLIEGRAHLRALGPA